MRARGKKVQYCHKQAHILQFGFREMAGKAHKETGDYTGIEGLPSLPLQSVPKEYV